MAKKLALEKTFNESATVDGYKRLVFSCTPLVDRLSDQLFTSAALALNQHRRRKGGHLEDQVVNLLHSLVFPHEALKRVPPAQFFIQRFQLRKVTGEPLKEPLSSMLDSNGTNLHWQPVSVFSSELRLENGGLARVGKF